MGRLKGNKCCPRCGSDDVLLQDMLSNNVSVYVCLECDKEFETGGHQKKHYDDHRSIQLDDDQENPPDYDEDNW